MAVEALGVFGAANVLVNREETARYRVVHAAVHVDEPESIEMLMAGETPVEHRGAGEASTPAVGVAKVAPGIVTQPLLHGAAAAGDSRPAAEVVLQDVMDRVRVVRSNNDGIHTRGSSQVGQPSRSGRVPRGFRHILAVAHIALGADSAANVLFHKDALVVIAVGVAQAVVALLDVALLVEASVGIQ